MSRLETAARQREKGVVIQLYITTLNYASGRAWVGVGVGSGWSRSSESCVHIRNALKAGGRSVASSIEIDHLRPQAKGWETPGHPPSAWDQLTFSPHLFALSGTDAHQPGRTLGHPCLGVGCGGWGWGPCLPRIQRKASGMSKKGRPSSSLLAARPQTSSCARVLLHPS